MLTVKSLTLTLVTATVVMLIAQGCGGENCEQYDDNGVCTSSTGALGGGAGDTDDPWNQDDDAEEAGDDGGDVGSQSYGVYYPNTKCDGMCCRTGTCTCCWWGDGTMTCQGICKK